MAAKEFILVSALNSISDFNSVSNFKVSPFVAIRSESLVHVNLFAEVFDGKPSRLVVSFTFDGSFSPDDFLVGFDAEKHLMDGVRLYIDVLTQLGVSLHNYQLEDFVPPELRHLIEVQPEVTGRP